MNKGISNGLICGIVIATALLLTQMTLACMPICGPCYKLVWRGGDPADPCNWGCQWKGCQPACDGTACKYCSETAGCVCKSWCSSGQSCCTDSPEGNCYGSGWRCCGDGHLCLAEDTCCNGGCCDTSQCMECKDGSCQSVCDPNNCEVCDEQGSCISTCDSSVCQQTCINGNCQDCGGDPDQYCCVSGNCCNWVNDEICCSGGCCEHSCCDSFDCEYCNGAGCEPCLRKVGTYAELLMCNKVPDPTWTPDPDGCSTPTGNNPAILLCWPSSGDDSDFVVACDYHDICYQTCNSSKGGCDSQFDTNMNDVCSSPTNSPQCKLACQFWRTIYAVAVDIVGQSYYEADQVKACACCAC